MLNNVPQTGQTLGATRNSIQTNFSTVDTAFTVDHVQYNDGSGGQGKHKKVTFPVQSPAPSFSAGEVGLYNFLNPLTAKNELYLHRITGASTSNIPMASSTLSGTQAPASLASFWTYLPSGMIIIKGTFTGSGLQTVTFSGAGIPTLTQVLGVFMQVSSVGSTTDSNINATFIDTPSVGTFRVRVTQRTTTSDASGTFFYQVWGY
jgi:hypothetical protein